MMIFIFINELKNISVFIFKYNSIKDIAKINTEQMCNNLYCEAETGRFQLAKNVYNLALPNDIYNAKTYTIFVLIYAIILFIYAFHLFMSFLYNDENKFKHRKYFISFIILYLLICFIMIIVMRYVPYDEKGYLNYFKKGNNYGLSADAFNSLIFTILIIVLIVFFVINRDVALNKKLMVIFISLYFIYALYFLLTMINIVAAFKDNKYPYENEDNSFFYKNENYTADISYSSENNYYFKYFNMKDIPNSIFTAYKGFFYNIHEIYMKNFIIHAIALFILFSLIALGYIIYKLIYNDVNDTFLNEYIYPLVPFLILLILLIYILNFTSFNTAFNKLVLYGATSSSYKRNLNNLNTIITPYIKLNTSNSNTQPKNYIYHCVILNVYVSYLHNYIDVTTNTPTIKPAKVYIDLTAPENFVELNLKTLTFNDKYFVNDDEFKNYYNMCMSTLKFDENNLKFLLQKYTPGNKNDYMKNIQKSIYYFINLIHNTDIYSIQNNTDFKDLIFYNENSKYYIYKFLNYNKNINDIINDTELENLKKSLEKYIDITSIDDIIKMFIDHLTSLKYDVDAKKSEDNQQNNTTIDDNIKTTVNYIKSIEISSEKQVDTTTKGDYFNTIDNEEKYKLYPLFNYMNIKVIEIPKYKGNIFLNHIENTYKSINDTNALLKLYNSVDYKEKKVLTEERFSPDLIINNNIDIVPAILHKANYVARESFVLTYIFNIIIIIMFYYIAISQK